MKSYLCSIYAKQKFIDFCVSELISLSSIHGICPETLFSTYNLPKTYTEYDYCEHFLPQITEKPFIYVNLPNVSAAEHIAKRGVCIERFTFPLAEADSISSLVENTLQRFNNDPEAAQFILAESPFAFRFDTYQSSVSQEEKESIVKSFGVIPFKGTVDLRSPERKFIVSISKSKCYFGLEIARSKDTRTRFYAKYSLSDREYLGPTTTDMELALLMANQGKVLENSLVLDPFVGTGGILIAASHFGATCFGGDIDVRVLKGLGVGRSTKNTEADIFTNFVNYGFQKPEIICCDTSRSCWKSGEIFDAIICDPPYGVRASSKKIKKDAVGTILPRDSYHGARVFEDLLNLAARLLRVGGRLVYLLPTIRNSYSKDAVPTHPLLKLVGNSENILSKKISRRLITMEKLEAPVSVENEEGKEQFYAGIREKWFLKNDN
ncbi:unnamed protein product [Blepharisma stoltei]|uniref:Uncharacterized protein n=1 Tax=Blepharisma stoltei TaxID=1481888 RepID=A0AAU9J900_9CILI|nr:unnamed protein product [Blepharisma stoltei]